ncbi:MAG TPA: hypothetical protein VE152_00420, partial [Acidimicrobiales bacterium]|nr:hypothetical protein [Acidimicrobiales bacterium]
ATGGAAGGVGGRLLAGVARVTRPARRRGRPGRLVAVAVALVTLVAGACLPASLGARAPRRLAPRGPAGPWRLTFDEEFAGASLDTARWATCYDWACTNAGNN